MTVRIWVFVQPRYIDKNKRNEEIKTIYAGSLDNIYGVLND